MAKAQIQKSTKGTQPNIHEDGEKPQWIVHIKKGPGLKWEQSPK